MAKVTAPVRGYSGISAGVRFVDGEAETNDPGALAYFRRAGYEVSGKAKGEFPTARVTEAAEYTFEPDEPAQVPFGAPLRDAAIEPKAVDFLPPTNAGRMDPHGPSVVAPGLHAVGPKPLRPGQVHIDDPKAQEAAETQLAEASLLQNKPADEAIAPFAEVHTTPVPTPAIVEATQAPKRTSSRRRTSSTKRASGPKSAK